MNPLLEGIPPSLIRALNAAKRPGDIDLGLGEPLLKPDLAPFEAATAWVRDHGCPYSPNAGQSELRAAIAEHYGYVGLGKPENVCVTVGSQEALYLAIKALCDPASDEVLLVGPSYPAYAKLCQMEGLAHRTVTLDAETGFAPDAEAVLRAIGPSTRLVLLASPANPTGRVWSAEALAALARGLAARPGQPVWVLIDEVYRELVYTEAPYGALADLYSHTLVANSLSKSNALTGLRLGWLMAPASVMPAIVKVHQFVNTAASTFSQRVALEVFRTPGATSSHRTHYLERRAHLLTTLAQLELAHVPPEGAFYCMLRLKGAAAKDSVAAAYRLLETHRVVTVPGAAFGAEGFLRVSWVAEPEPLSTGLGRIAEFLEG